MKKYSPVHVIDNPNYTEENHNFNNGNYQPQSQSTTISNLKNTVLDIVSKKRDAKKIFDELDSNQDGKLVISEVKQLFEHRDTSKFNVLLLSKHFMERADEDGDNMLDFDEFYKIYESEHIWHKGTLAKYLSTFEAKKELDLEPVIVVQSPRLCKPAFAIIFISVVQLVFYYVESEDRKLASTFRFQPYCKRDDIWRYFTYMFVHNENDHLHVWMNVLFQIILGMPLEFGHSWWRVLIIYLSGVLFGAFGYSFFSPCGILVGASAGVFSLLTAHLSNSFLNWNLKSNAPVHFLVITIFIVIEVILYFTEPAENVSYAAHLFGGIAGFIMGLCVLKNTCKAETKKKLLFLMTAFQIFIFVATIYNYIAFTVDSKCECDE